MGFSGTGKVWMNGAMVEWADATVHIASHVIFLPVLSLGGTLVVDTYRTDDTIALIGSLGINSFFGVPSILLMMAVICAPLYRALVRPQLQT